MNLGTRCSSVHKELSKMGLQDRKWEEVSPVEDRSVLIKLDNPFLPYTKLRKNILDLQRL